MALATCSGDFVVGGIIGLRGTERLQPAQDFLLAGLEFADVGLKLFLTGL